MDQYTQPPYNLPAVPEGLKLWPNSRSFTANKTKNGVALHMSILSTRPILAALAHGVMSCMGSAGHSIASSERPGLAPMLVKEHNLTSEFNREEAAQLLSAYTALYVPPSYEGSTTMSPKVLKEAAERSFRAGIRDGRHMYGIDSGSKFRDDLYSQVAPSQGLKPSSGSRKV